ncbi:TPA: fructose-bisphosphatase class III [Streptococcus pyogenes]|nr:fructose-bisphosphatase class III [Streptococcus pyogenes]
MIFVIWMRLLVVDHLYVAGDMFNRGHYLDLFLDWLVSK